MKRMFIAGAIVAAASLGASQSAVAASGTISTPPITIDGCQRSENVTYDTANLQQPVRVYGEVHC